MKFLWIAFFSLAASAHFAQTGAAYSAPASCTLPAPSGFSAIWTGGGSAYFQWTSVAGASAYRLKVYDESGLVSNTVEYGTSKTMGGLSSGQAHRCELAAICEDNSTSSYVIVTDIINP